MAAEGVNSQNSCQHVQKNLDQKVVLDFMTHNSVLFSGKTFWKWFPIAPFLVLRESDCPNITQFTLFSKAGLEFMVFLFVA